MLYLITFLIFAAAAGLTLGLVPILVKRGGAMAQANTAKFNLRYDAVLTEEQIKKVRKMMFVLPLLIGVAALLFAPADIRLVALLVGMGLGFIIPRFYLINLIPVGKRRFND